MRVVILVPWRSDNGGRRDFLWAFTRKWFEQHHDVPIYEGHSPDGPFNRGAAINDAAMQARDWDVALVTDTDNIAHPATVEQAVDIAHRTGKVVFPFECYTYLDGPSTDALIRDDNWFLAPYKGNKGYAETVKFHHYSGIQAVSRPTWDAVGGFISFTGWGAEDAVMEQLFEQFTAGATWLHGGAYHLFHEPMWYAQPTETAHNRHIYAQILRLRGNKPALRQYLHKINHPIL